MGTMTHGNKGGDSTEAGQHPRLNGEDDLWNGWLGLRLELLVRGIPYEEIDHCIRAL